MVTFLRHGEKQKVKDVPDNEVPLTENGKAQGRAYGQALHSFYQANNISGVYVDTFSSQADRTHGTIAEAVSAESSYNKPVKQDDRLGFDVEGFDTENVNNGFEVAYANTGTLEGAFNWYLDTEHSKAVATNYANFLSEKEGKLSKLQEKGKRFHVLVGTHSPLAESLLKQAVVKDGSAGIDSIYDIGAPLEYAEAVHVLYKADGSTQVSFHDNVYDLDMSHLQNPQ